MWHGFHNCSNLFDLSSQLFDRSELLQSRILIISAQKEKSGSAYTYRLKSLAGLLEDRGFKCDYFYMEDHPPLDTETTRAFFTPLWLNKLRQYDLIYCGAAEAAQALFFCKFVLPAPVIMDMHGDVVSQSAQTNIILSNGKKTRPSIRVWLLYKMSLTISDYFITQSEYQKEDLINEGVGKDNVSVVRNGVDLDTFPLMEIPPCPEFSLGYIGAFQTWQGTEYLYEAIGLMKNKDARILLIGFDEYEDDWKKAFKDTYGNRVEVLSKMDRAQLSERMRSVSVFMSPRPPHIASRAAFPTKFAEYASMGRPILVTDVDETAEFVKRYDCGFVCKATSQDLADAMDRAVQTPLETLVQMGRNARAMAEQNFAWPRIGDDYAELVRHLIATRSKRRQTLH